jgi:hypothetical protein
MSEKLAEVDPEIEGMARIERSKEVFQGRVKSRNTGEGIAEAQ